MNARGQRDLFVIKHSCRECTAQPIANRGAHTSRTWQASQVQRLGQLPLEADGPAPARIEASVTRLNKRVKNMPGDAKVAVSEEEDKLLRDVLRCERLGCAR